MLKYFLVDIRKKLSGLAKSHLKKIVVPLKTPLKKVCFCTYSPLFSRENLEP